MKKSILHKTIFVFLLTAMAYAIQMSTVPLADNISRRINITRLEYLNICAIMFICTSITAALCILNDKYGSKKFISIALTLSSTGLILSVTHYNIHLFRIGYILLGLGYGFISPTCRTIIQNTTKDKIILKRSYSIYTMFVSLGGATGVFLGYFFSNKNFEVLFTSYIIITIFLFIYFLRYKHHYHKKAKHLSGHKIVLKPLMYCLSTINYLLFAIPFGAVYVLYMFTIFIVGNEIIKNTEPIIYAHHFFPFLLSTCYITGASLYMKLHNHFDKVNVKLYLSAILLILVTLEICASAHWIYLLCFCLSVFFIGATTPYLTSNASFALRKYHGTESAIFMMFYYICVALYAKIYAHLGATHIYLISCYTITISVLLLSAIVYHFTKPKKDCD